MIRRLSAVLAAFLLAVGGTQLVTPGAANASCAVAASGYLDARWAFNCSLMYSYYWTAIPTTCKNVNTGSNEWLSNRSGHNVRVFRYQNCTGPTAIMYNGTSGYMSGDFEYIASIRRI